MAASDIAAAILALGANHVWGLNEEASPFADSAPSGKISLTAAAGCTPGAYGPVCSAYSIGGPQTLAPTFDASTSGYASGSGAPIQGLGWGIFAVVAPAVNPTDLRTIYSQSGSSGNDLLAFYFHPPNLGLKFCDDTAGNSRTVATGTSASALYSAGAPNASYCVGVTVSDAGVPRAYAVSGPRGWGGSAGQMGGTMVASGAWTNSSLTTYIGYDPKVGSASAFNGSICWVAVFTSEPTAADFLNFHKAVNPIPAGLHGWTKAISGAVYPNSQLWNEPLPDDAPIHPDSDAIIAAWRAYGVAHGVVEGCSPYVTMYDVDEAPAGPVGNRSQFLIAQEQNKFLATVPTPDPLFAGSLYPANGGADGIMWGAAPSMGLQYDLFHAIRLGGASDAAPFPLTSPYISSAVAAGGGQLASGSYTYTIGAVNANGEGTGIAGGYNASMTVSVPAGGQVTLSFYVDVRGTPPPTSWRVHRKGPGAGTGTDADYGVVATLTNLKSGQLNVWVDTGASSPNYDIPVQRMMDAATSGNYWGAWGTARCSDPCSTGGGGSWDWLKNCGFNPNWKPSGGNNNGESASSCPAGAGVVTIEEALAGLIEHPLVMALPAANQSSLTQGMFWPAKRHDGWSTNTNDLTTREGMRFRLPVGFDEDTITYSTYAPAAAFQKALVVCLRDYGVIIRDSAISNGLLYLESTVQSGQDAWPYIFGGMSTGLVSIISIMTPVPWGSLQVLMPFRYGNRKDVSGRHTNRTDVSGYPTMVPY